MKRLGVIGAGQLGQMLGFAAAKLGIEVTFLDPAPDPPAALAGRVIARPFDSADGLAQLRLASDVMTYEFENVPVSAVEPVAATIPVYPPPAALRCAQDRLLEKELFRRLHIPLPAFRPVDSRQELDLVATVLGFPFVLKTRTQGYDGKGQTVLRSPADLDDAWTLLGNVPLVAEEWVDFDYEVSAIGARDERGDCIVYPLTENRHSDGILRVSKAPCPDDSLFKTASSYLLSLLQHFDYVGVLALELFVRNGQLLANEFAPRVHNSGHWTIEGAVTSQFENHVRAVTGMPLGDPSAVACAGMINLIGSIPLRSGQADFQYFLHDYGKSARPQRKLGHITLLADDALTRDERLSTLEKALAESQNRDP